MPINSRVEAQAFGRTSRQGKRGTAQLIMHQQDENNRDSIETLMQKRDDFERKITDDGLNKVLPLMRLRDRLFKKFCDLLMELRNLKVDAMCINNVKIKWGIWFLMMNLDDTSSRDDQVELEDNFFIEIEQKFEIFCQEIRTHLKHNNFINNPINIISRIRQVLFDDSVERNIKVLEDVVLYDQQCSFIAYYYLGIFYYFRYRTEIKEALSPMLTRDDTLLKSKQMLKKAQKIVLNMMPQYECALFTLRYERNEDALSLDRQFLNNVVALHFYKIFIDKSIDHIELNGDTFHFLPLDFDYFVINEDDRRDFLHVFSGVESVYNIRRNPLNPLWHATSINLINDTNIIFNTILEAVNNSFDDLKSNTSIEGIVELFMNKLDDTEYFSKDDFVKKVIYTLKISTCGLNEYNRIHEVFSNHIKLSTKKIYPKFEKLLVTPFTRNEWHDLATTAFEIGNRDFLNRLQKLTCVIKEIISDNLTRVLNDIKIDSILQTFNEVKRLLDAPDSNIPIINDYMIEKTVKDLTLFTSIAKDLINQIDEDKIDRNKINNLFENLYLTIKNDVMDDIKCLENIYSIESNIAKLAKINEAYKHELYSCIKDFISSDKITVSKKITHSSEIENEFDSPRMINIKNKLVKIINRLYEAANTENTSLKEQLKVELCALYECNMYYKFECYVNDVMKKKQNESKENIINALKIHLDKSSLIKFDPSISDEDDQLEVEREENKREKFLRIDYDDLIKEDNIKEQNESINKLLEKHRMRIEIESKLNERKIKEIFEKPIKESGKPINQDNYKKVLKKPFA